MLRIGLRVFVMLALPMVWLWARLYERRALRHGRPLSDWERHVARLAGVREPRRIRVCVGAEMPRPGQRWMQGIAARWGLSMDDTLGLSLRYGIYLREDHPDWIATLAHECAHTAQYERLGGLWPFLRHYLWQCLSHGYSRAPLEIEANRITRRICASRHEFPAP
jgi:hypothetical protein